ncbi:MAG: zinc ribbon domain-containing protein [Methanomassiliicoccaceae archaeon]|nr:zinc ribbon domain-containing protein [Methanomassiliicoccaceae archaeon]
MKCPKCQHDNDERTIFCEECDHRLDQPYRKKTLIPPVYGALTASMLGVLSLITAFEETAWFLPAVLGAVGIFLGSFSMSAVRKSGLENKMQWMALSGIGMALSVIGFMWGLSLL